MQALSVHVIGGIQKKSMQALSERNTWRACKGKRPSVNVFCPFYHVHVYIDTIFFSCVGDLLPMFYFVPKEQIDIEKYPKPGGAEMYPSAEGSTDGVFLWGQSVYFISQLLSTYILYI